MPTVATISTGNRARRAPREQSVMDALNARISAGRKLRDVAVDLGLSPGSAGYLHNVISGRRRPSRRLAALLVPREADRPNGDVRIRITRAAATKLLSMLDGSPDPDLRGVAIRIAQQAGL